MANRLTSAGLALIEQFEGLRLTAYQDQASVWTIGYGHTPSFAGQTITAGFAQVLLKQDLNTAALAVAAATHDVATTDNQFSAMVSLVFNIGAAAFRTSSVLRLHRVGHYSVASTAFLLWDKIHQDGNLILSQGLLNRRRAEAKLYLS